MSDLDLTYGGSSRMGADIPPDRVAQLATALAGTVAARDEYRAEVHALEAELVEARSRSDDWRSMAIQLAATCRDLRNDLTAARWAGVI